VVAFFFLEAKMAKGNSYKGRGGKVTGHSLNRQGSLGYGALRNTISRGQAANLARRVSMGGSGG